MKFAVFILFAASAFAGSDPFWLPYTSQNAASPIGVEWKDLRNSPQLHCLGQARKLVSSPRDLLAIASGNFPQLVVTDEAQTLGLRAEVYRGIQLWLPRDQTASGLAQVSEQLILIGSQSALELAIDRAGSKTPAVQLQTKALPPEVTPTENDSDPAPFKFTVTHMESSKPQIIRIFNLEGGTREIVLPLTIPTDAAGNPLPLR